SCRGLHAKAFVFGKTAVVGSANVSARSKNILIEAAIETTEPKTVRSCVQFVRDWCRKRITKRDVERLAPLYNPAGGRGGKYLAEREENHLRPLWAVALSRMDWDQEDTRQADRARPLARKEIGDRRQFRLEEFCWPGNDLTERLSERDMVLQVMSEPGKRVLIHPPSNVIRIQQYHVRNSKRMIVFLREPKKNRINLKRLVKRLEAPSKNLRKLKRCRLLKNPKLVGELLRLWRVPQTTEKG